MPIADEIAAYIAQVEADVSTKTATNSIEPTAVGEIGTDLAALLLPHLSGINNYGITQGSGVPSNLNGSNLDLYFRSGNPLEIYRKVDGSWVLLVSLSLGYTLPNGPLTLRTTIAGMIVTISLGGWVIDNVVYQKFTQTQFTLTSANLNYTRYDLIYADKNNAILKLDGVASVSSVYPACPADCVVVDYAIVPSSSSGDGAYLLYGGGIPTVDEIKTILTHLNGTFTPLEGTLNLGGSTIPSNAQITYYQTISGVEYTFSGMFAPASKLISGIDPLATAVKIIFI